MKFNVCSITSFKRLFIILYGFNHNVVAVFMLILDKVQFMYLYTHGGPMVDHCQVNGPPCHCCIFKYAK